MNLVFEIRHLDISSDNPKSEILTVACCVLPITYLITLSALASTFGGIVRLIC